MNYQRKITVSLGFIAVGTLAAALYYFNSIHNKYEKKEEFKYFEFYGYNDLDKFHPTDFQLRKYFKENNLDLEDFKEKYGEIELKIIE